VQSTTQIRGSQLDSPCGMFFFPTFSSKVLRNRICCSSGNQCVVCKVKLTALRNAPLGTNANLKARPHSNACGSRCGTKLSGSGQWNSNSRSGPVSRSGAARRAPCPGCPLAHVLVGGCSDTTVPSNSPMYVRGRTRAMCTCMLSIRAALPWGLFDGG